MSKVEVTFASPHDLGTTFSQHLSLPPAAPHPHCCYCRAGQQLARGRHVLPQAALARPAAAPDALRAQAARHHPAASDRGGGGHVHGQVRLRHHGHGGARRGHRQGRDPGQLGLRVLQHPLPRHPLPPLQEPGAGRRRDGREPARLLRGRGPAAGLRVETRHAHGPQQRLRPREQRLDLGRPRGRDPQGLRRAAQDHGRQRRRHGDLRPCLVLALTDGAVGIAHGEVCLWCRQLQLQEPRGLAVLLLQDGLDVFQRHVFDLEVVRQLRVQLALEPLAVGALVLGAHGQVAGLVVHEVGLQLVQPGVLAGPLRGARRPALPDGLSAAVAAHLLLELDARERAVFTAVDGVHGAAVPPCLGVVVVSVVQTQHAALELVGQRRDVRGREPRVEVAEAAQHQRRVRVQEAREPEAPAAEQPLQVLVELGAALGQELGAAVAAQPRAASPLELVEGAEHAPRGLQLRAAVPHAAEHHARGQQELGLRHERAVELRAVHAHAHLQQRRHVTCGHAHGIPVYCIVGCICPENSPKPRSGGAKGDGAKQINQRAWVERSGGHRLAARQLPSSCVADPFEKAYLVLDTWCGALPGDREGLHHPRTASASIRGATWSSAHVACSQRDMTKNCRCRLLHTAADFAASCSRQPISDAWKPPVGNAELR
ncbi:hypothetical protein ON010_g5607 [Phytophthora cinnamomi]|nr:hypothetical protein ON010_g5607 [Phytophthora cinnamomi]